MSECREICVAVVTGFLFYSVFFPSLLAADITNEAQRPPHLLRLNGPDQTPCPQLLRNLARGSSGNDVVQLQSFLADRGYFAGPATGYFGPLTANAIKIFQSRNSIPPIGIVGPLTRSALNRACSSTQISGAPSGRNTASVITDANCVIAYDPNDPLSFLNIGTTCAESSPSSLPSPNGDAAIYNSHQTLKVVTSDYLAGAISAIFWNGKQLIYDLGHGNQLQYTAAVDGFGALYNPTEAGSNDDDYHLRLLDDTHTSDIYLQHDTLLGPPWATIPQTSLTSSILRSFSLTGSRITAVSQMAFWGIASDPPVSGTDSETGAVYTYPSNVPHGKVSNYTISKTIQLGVNNWNGARYVDRNNVVEMEATITIPPIDAELRAALDNSSVYYWLSAAQRSAPTVSFEAPTAYLLPGFSHYYELVNPGFAADYRDISTFHGETEDAPFETSNPIIYATADKQYAMGVYALPSANAHPVYRTYVSGSQYSTNSSKWSIAYNGFSLGANASIATFKTYLVFGTVDEVAGVIRSLYYQYQPSQSAQKSTAPDLRISRYHGVGTPTEWFLTSDASEGTRLSASSYWIKDGIVGNIFSYPAPNTVPLMRFYEAASGDHYYTTSQTDANRTIALGYRKEVNIGYAYAPDTTANSLTRAALLRAYNTATKQHFYTTNATEFDNLLIQQDWSDDGIAAYLPF